MMAKKYRATDAWTLPKLKKATAVDLQLAVRLEAADSNGQCTCVSCGRVGHYKSMHAGHFIGGRSNGVLFDERNLHVQCAHCNWHQHGNLEGYSVFMLAKYGQKIIDELTRAKNAETKFTRDELNAMRDGYKKRIKAKAKP